MATIPTLTAHSPARAADVQAVIDALTNQFGLTDTVQTNMGRLAVPSVSADPSSLVVGSMWFRNDLGDNGRLRIHDADSQTHSLLGLRQRVESAALAAIVTITSTSLADVTNLTLSITTTGGRLKITMGTSYPDYDALYCSEGTALSTLFGIAAIVGATQLGELGAGNEVEVNNQNCVVPPSAFVWNSKPAAGTYTVKLQARVITSGASLNFNGAAGPLGISLIVEEFDD